MSALFTPTLGEEKPEEELMGKVCLHLILSTEKRFLFNHKNRNEKFFDSV